MSVAFIQTHVDRISPKDIRDEDNELIVGLAFGQDFLAKIYPDADKNGVEPFPFRERKGKMGKMPSTGKFSYSSANFAPYESVIGVCR